MERTSIERMLDAAFLKIVGIDTALLIEFGVPREKIPGWRHDQKEPKTMLDAFIIMRGLKNLYDSRLEVIEAFQLYGIEGAFDFLASEMGVTVFEE